MPINLETYDVTAVNETRFRELTWYVQRSQNSLRSNAKRDEPKIKVVSDTFDTLPRWQRETARKRARSGTLLGLAWGWFGVIWVRPNRPAQETEKTLLHEISHCFVEDQSHGPRFRRIYCVALAYWGRSLGWGEVEVERAISNTVRAYRHYREWTPQGRYNSWADYDKKVADEVDKLYRASLKG